MSTVVDLSLDALEAMLQGEPGCEVRHVESHCTGNVVGIMNDSPGHRENGKKCCSGVVEWRNRLLMEQPGLRCALCMGVGNPNPLAVLCWHIIPI